MVMSRHLTRFWCVNVSSRLMISEAQGGIEWQQGQGWVVARSSVAALPFRCNASLQGNMAQRGTHARTLIIRAPSAQPPVRTCAERHLCILFGDPGVAQALGHAHALAGVLVQQPALHRWVHWYIGVRQALGGCARMWAGLPHTSSCPQLSRPACRMQRAAHVPPHSSHQRWSQVLLTTKSLAASEIWCHG